MGHKESSGEQRTRAIVATLVTFAALLVLFFWLYSFPPSFNLKPHEALGKELASESLKQLGPGGRLFVITRDTTGFESPAIEAQLKSFARTAKAAGANLAATNLIKVDPARLVGVPRGEFFRFPGGVSGADVIASFLGPPELSDARVASPKDRPRVAAVCSGAMPDRVDLRRLFTEQLLHVAIISRPTVASPSPSTDTPQAWFDHLYQVITPANLPDLPPPKATRR